MTGLRLTVVILSVIGGTIHRSLAAFVINFDANPFNARKWPSTTINYRLSKSFLPDEVANINEAFRQFQESTCLRFNDTDTAVDGGIVFFRTNDKKCRGTVGKQPQNVVYGYRRCWTKVGYIMHEIMHNLGFRHEHQRPDRDQHIRLLFDHIQPNKRRFFDRIDDLRSHDTLNSAYDAYSVMHYEPTQFAKADHAHSLEPANDRWIVDFIGQKRRLSSGDIDAINKLYCSS